MRTNPNCKYSSPGWHDKLSAEEVESFIVSECGEMRDRECEVGEEAKGGNGKLKVRGPWAMRQSKIKQKKSKAREA